MPKLEEDVERRVYLHATIDPETMKLLKEHAKRRRKTVSRMIDEIVKTYTLALLGQ